METKLVEAMNYIHSREKFGSRPGLHRIKYLLNKLGNPQDELKIIHIAGTNGKGSTVTYLQELLFNSGFCVGTYTSPYIEKFNERICINGFHIPDKDIVYLVHKLQPIILEMDRNEEVSGLTEFELVTAMMYCYFVEKNVDVAVIEVGLGGLLDSTNVGHPIISGITTIGYDHMLILGDTIEKIAEQKAGIIKEKGIVVTGNIPQIALQVIEEKAEKCDAEIYRYNQEFFVNHILSRPLSQECFAFSNDIYYFPFLSISLLGNHQVENAGTALQIYLLFMEKLQLTVNWKVVEDSLLYAFIPGRMEIILERPLVIIDGAHNVPGIERLQRNLQEMLLHRPSASKLFILFSAINTKDVSGMIRLLEDLPEANLTVTSFEYDTALSLAEMAKYSNGKVNINGSWEEAAEHLLNQMDDDDFLLITGSLYFISTVRKKIKELFKRQKTILKMN